MLLKIWLANIILAAVVLFVGMKTAEVWTEKRPFKISSAQQPPTWAQKLVAEGTMPPELEYEIVVSDNLFFADRSEVQQKEPKKKSSSRSEDWGRAFKDTRTSRKAYQSIRRYYSR